MAFNLLNATWERRHPKVSMYMRYHLSNGSYTLWKKRYKRVSLISRLIKFFIHSPSGLKWYTGADPGFFLGGGAPLTD